MKNQTSKHTPGSWHFGCVGHPDKIQVVVCANPDREAPTGLICEVNKYISFNPGTRRSTEAEANAHLIAAAPGLLDVIKAALTGHCSGNCPDCNSDHPEDSSDCDLCAWIVKAEAAIAKAEGRTK